MSLTDKHASWVNAVVGAAAFLLTLVASATQADNSPTSVPGPSTPVAQRDSAPPVRAIGLLRSADPRQSRAILDVAGAGHAEYAEGDSLANGWKVTHIYDAAIVISNGARVVRIPVVGGDAHPLVRQQKPSESTAHSSSAEPTSSPSPLAPEQVLRDAARRRAIHALSTD